MAWFFVARRPRIEFPGATYHVINRGNFRKDLFSPEGSAKAFEKVLAQTCAKCGWRLGAYCIMGNHFHLALETPNGNLVEGMHWLQSTFGNRFNRYWDEAGHVFQGRYKAILVEPGIHWLRVVDYIHLNPARAGLVSPEASRRIHGAVLRNTRTKGTARVFWSVADWLEGSLGLKDNASGWRNYQARLKSALQTDGDGKDSDEEIGTGWILGTSGYRKAVLKDLEQMTLAKDWGGPELRALNEMQWTEVLEECLERLGKSPDDIRKDIKSADWKAAIAWWLKSQTSASNRWLGESLNMGVPAMVSRLVARMQSPAMEGNARGTRRSSPQRVRADPF